MFDLKVIHSVLGELEEERGIPREKVIEAIETALATAYRKDYGKRGQIVRAQFDLGSGKTEFYQVKVVVDPSSVYMPDETEEEIKNEDKIRFNPEQHILLPDARKIKRDAEVEEELIFPLPDKGDYGRIAAQTAKQVIIQKIREAEKVSVLDEFGQREGEVVHGTVQRIERGNIYVDLGRSQGIILYDEQIPGERFRQGDRIRAYLYSVEEGHRGIFLRLSRSRSEFLRKLFEMEVPELVSGVVEIQAIAREPGSRSKVAVISHDDHVDPVGALVGQRGVRVQTVTSELGGEKIDVIEWSDDPHLFIEEALQPARILSVEIDEKGKIAHVEVSEDQQSLAIGRAGQNVRLAARLVGAEWKIDIHSIKGETIAEGDAEHVEVKEEDGSKPNAGASEVHEESESAHGPDKNEGEAPKEDETK